MPPEIYYEAHLVSGLEELSLQEMRTGLGSSFHPLILPQPHSGVLRFHYPGDPRRLLQLKTILAVFSVQLFPVPRPKALLGHQNYQKLVEQLNTARALHPKRTFQTFYLAAAGSDSNLMVRLKHELAKTVGLKVSDDEGDLLLRLRRPRDSREGWEAVVRLSPRPLSVRSWRVCDHAGGLNASIAHAMITFTKPASGQVFLNPGCGSGTLLIERLSAGPAQLALGFDIDPTALACARENIQASPLRASIQVYPWDAAALPLPNQSVDAITSDLPFGHDVGSHAENESLYPQLLQEAARVAKPGAPFVLITHEVRLIARLLERSQDWNVEQVLPITIAGLHPRIYVLRRAALTR
jgi:tRNA (guanine6-N2)-methyltransferase